MDRIIQVMEEEDPSTYESVLVEFLRFAHQKDVSEMLARTSAVTVQRFGGEQAMSDNYTNDKLPVLTEFYKMQKGGENLYLPPNDGSVGWAFRRTFKSDKGEIKRFQFIVLKESGKIGVSGMSIM